MFVACQFLFGLILCGDNPVCGSASIYTVSGVYSVSLYISLSGLFPVVLGLMPALFSVRRIAILFSDHTRVF